MRIRVLSVAQKRRIRDEVIEGGIKTAPPLNKARYFKSTAALN